MYYRLKPQASPRGKTDVKVGEFVAAEYELEWYLGEVISVDDEDGELQEALKEKLSGGPPYQTSCGIIKNCNGFVKVSSIGKVKTNVRSSGLGDRDNNQKIQCILQGVLELNMSKFV